MARALAFRVGFSILLFVCILMAWKLGYIQPTGLPSWQVTPRLQHQPTKKAPTALFSFGCGAYIQ
jgi:hypothetical protein